MNTWEMVKALTENPKLKAKILGSDPKGNTVGIDDSGMFFVGDTVAAYLSHHFLTQQWELIQ